MANDDELTTAIHRLTAAMQSNVRAQGYWRSFLHGIVAGIGGTVGVALVLTGLAWFLRHAAVIPVIGHWLSDLTPYVQSALHR